MRSSRTALIALVLVATPLAACASDESPENEPVDGTVPLDTSVDDGVDTEVEQGDNLGFEGDES